MHLKQTIAFTQAKEILKKLTQNKKHLIKTKKLL